MHIRWRGLELPGSVEADSKTLTGTYGKFTAEPLNVGSERPWGTACGGFCFQVSRGAQSHRSNSAAPSMNSPR